jgi:hypothetical protein
VWVGNVGKGGITTRHHILQLKHFLRQYPGIDAIIMLVGINDFSRRLAEDVNYDPCFLDKPGCEEKLLLEAFSLLPVGRNWALPYYKRTALWHLARKFKYRMFSLGQIQDIKGNYLVEWRKYRKDAVVIRNVLPDLSSALEEYSRNINTIIDMAQKKSVRPIFVTQPFLWRPDLPQHFKDLLWFGGIGKFGQEEEREYYSVEALAAGMKMYNETLMKICNERQIECFDLASFVTKDTTVFYDDCHFNTSGAEKIATILARYMLQCEPFSNYVKDNEERMAAQHD